MTASNLSINRSETERRNLKARRVLTAGLISVMAAVVANLIARAVLLNVLDVTEGFAPYGLAPIVLFTTLGTFLGTLVLLALTRFSARPTRVYTIVALVALVISILPNLGLMANPAAMAFPFGSPGSALDFGVLIVFHIVAAVTHLAVLHGILKR